MKRKHVISVLVGVVLGIIIFYTFKGGVSPEEYEQSVLKERKQKESFLLRSDESPLDENMKENFPGLNYYSPDPDFKVKARFEPAENDENYKIPTSTGAEDVYRKAGFATFTLKGQKHQLLILSGGDSPDNPFFLAFADETSGDETYGGGRYLDVKPSGATVTLDFNLSYNPYCAYNPKFSCPLPPKENILSVPITAGEKTFEKHE